MSGEKPSQLQPNQSHELALAVLKTAAREGTLSDAYKAELAELLGKGVRSKLERTLETPVAAESAESEKLNPELAVYKQEYDSLPDAIKARSSWEAIAGRLLVNNGEKLKRVQAMGDGGQLFGIDAGGKALFKDKGVEPVMYGYDEENKLLKIYDRKPEQMEQVTKWANYFEIRRQVLKDGYGLFADDGNYGFSEEMEQVRDHTGEPFVASKNKAEWRVSWLESGDKPGDARRVYFVPVGGRVSVSGGNPEVRGDYCGVVRLLRV